VIYWKNVVDGFKQLQITSDVVMDQSLLEDLDDDVDDIFGDLEAVEEEIDPTNAQRHQESQPVDEFGMEEGI
jgi:hypothetical protein